MMRYFALVTLICTALLTACGPSYRTDYTLKSPVSRAGKQCANDCYYVRQGCIDACQGYASSCGPSSSVSFGYGSFGRHSYSGVSFGTGYPLHSRRHHYDDYCEDNRDICSEQCEANYRACFAGCGGKVIPSTVCTANCAAP